MSLLPDDADELATPEAIRNGTIMANALLRRYIGITLDRTGSK